MEMQQLVQVAEPGNKLTKDKKDKKDKDSKNTDIDVRTNARV